MQADTLQVELDIQSALADASQTELGIYTRYNDNPPRLTVNDAQRIIECLRETPRINTLTIMHFSLNNTAALYTLRIGLPLCTSITMVAFHNTHLGNKEMEYLVPAFYNTSVMTLSLVDNNIQGQRGGEVLRNLLNGNQRLLELNLIRNPIGPEGASGLGKGLIVNKQLRKLNLVDCGINNESLANLLSASEDMINNSLTILYLHSNGIEGADGGRKLTLLLQRFRALKVLSLNHNRLGPLGAYSLALGLAAATCCLETLGLAHCWLGNEGVMNLVLIGQENRSLTNLDIGFNNVQHVVGGENVISLASRCTNLDGNDYHAGLASLALMIVDVLSPDQQHRLNLIFDRKRLVTAAKSLAGSPFAVLFQFVEKVHHHEHGLGAIFIILQNDGDDYFCNALNRA